MTLVGTPDGRGDGRGDDVDDAWAKIVAGYGPEPDDRTTLDADPGEPRNPDSPEVDAAPADAAPGDAAPADEEWHYVPPAPPPLPRPVGVVGAAWVALLGGPIVLLVATVLGWDLPTVVTAACVLGFVGGLVFLIAQLDDGSRDGPDGWDNGAQV